MSFQSAGNFLNDLIYRLAGEKLRDYSTILLAWKNIVGKPVAGKAKPVKFENGVLSVAVTNSVWLQELILYKHKIRSKYRLRHNIEIRDIIFYINSD
jgi:predicted nucleic acid-binding Zn ribbon protein